MSPWFQGNVTPEIVVWGAGADCVSRVDPKVGFRRPNRSPLTIFAMLIGAGDVELTGALVERVEAGQGLRGVHQEHLDHVWRQAGVGFEQESGGACNHRRGHRRTAEVHQFHVSRRVFIRFQFGILFDQTVTNCLGGDDLVAGRNEIRFDDIVVMNSAVRVD